MRKLSLHIPALVCVLLSVLALSSSCSMTRVLSEGEFRLEKNELNVTNSDSFDTGELSAYLKQPANPYLVLGWNPLIGVYNWSAKSPDSRWGRMCRNVGVAPVVYNPEAVGSTEENIISHLEYLGYYGSRVDSRVSVRKRNVRVAYDVTLGKRYVIDSLSFDLPSRGTFAADFFADTANLTVRRGDYLSEAALEEESKRGESVFRDLGYYGFSKNHYIFEADTVSEPGRLLLKLTVGENGRNELVVDSEPLRKFHIGKVSITRPKDLKFNDIILRELNTVTPGQPYSESGIAVTYNRLSALKLFNSVGIELTRADTATVDCAINLTKTQLQGVKINLEASTNSTGLMGISPQLSLFHRNVFHGGEWLNLSFMGNFQFKLSDGTRANEFGVSAGLSFPKFLGLPYSMFKGDAIPRTEINLSYNFQDRPEYTRNIVSTSFGYTGTFRGKYSYQIYPLQLNMVRLDNLDESFLQKMVTNPFIRYTYQDHFDAGVGGTLYYNSSSVSNPKGSYSYFRVSADMSGGVLSLFNSLMAQDANGFRMLFRTPYSQYVRGEVSVGRTWRFGRELGQAMATRLLAGAGHAYGNSLTLPFEKQFYCGGANSMRGWQSRTLGPGASPVSEFFTIPSQTGDMKLEANVEYRFDLFWKLDGALFVDAGNVWTIQREARENSFSFDTVAADWGAGVRVDLDFLVLRVDMGMKLRDPLREQRWVAPAGWLKRDGYAVHFGVGYPF